MKTKFYTLISFLALAALSFAPVIVKAQEQQMQFFRPNNKLGINVFETSKKDTVKFTGLKVKVGGGFTMNFQSLRASNTATPVLKTVGTTVYNTNALTPLIDGFNLPMANMSFDVQLADGVRLNLTSYLATRHHEETWVKGGYIQIDKVEFLHSEFLNRIMKSVTVTIGESDIDYGDQHYRRSDGGNTIYNPFVENYIMDEFSTEIGMHIYYKCAKTGLFAMGAITNGELNPTTIESTKVDAETGNINKYPPAFLGKLGYDKQLNTDFRLRVTGSFYTVNSANSSTLFGGDRSGSNYYNVFSTPYGAATTTTTQAIDYNAFSGRFNPGFSQENHSYMGNLFLKYKGLEFFGTAETAKGRTITEVSNRSAKQFAGDLIYRFPENKENFWVGYRYNTVSATIVGNTTDVTINRNVASAGWFLTRNIMMKGEYVDQRYKDFDATSLYNGGVFKGFMFSAVVGF
ncbi:hypothetical protein [Mucilaginibacter paludis]|uniref:Uncharacterized protein n=1 Tax=Mucilaginibacter paludis DSM 18603 TaxID=714943 RepID=H1YC13_9SPHI|nr:hypothetical protein [Mucilaginibacter paludis]EHQ27091.1 hypothetical protein Mucpa_2984 [Mucilaginibacter paludis DSM 18603]